jgi:flagellin-like protein
MRALVGGGFLSFAPPGALLVALMIVVVAAVQATGGQGSWVVMVPHYH